jgi:poly(A) polymerase
MADGWWRIEAGMDVQAARALLYRLEPGRYLDRVLLAWSRTFEDSASDARWHALAGLPQRWTAPVFPLRAADFISRGVAPGPALGAALRAAEAAWIAEGFPMDAAALERIAAGELGKPR